MQQPPQPLHPQQQRRSYRRLLLILSIVALVLLSYVGVRVLATHTSTSASKTPVTQQTSLPTQPLISTPGPTQQAVTLTQTPTQAPSVGAAILGGTILAFSARYGPPDSDSGVTPGSNTTGHYGYLHHTYDVVTQGAHVVSIVANAPGDTTWSLREAQSICLPFAPPDSVYKQTVMFLDSQKKPTALHMVYYSAFLSKQLPASDFKDQNGNLATPGAFDIIFTYNAGDTSQVVSCTL